jgi:hypoxia-inducible factor 1-alpha inhibitor (HIF hydroxylase)
MAGESSSRMELKKYDFSLESIPRMCWTEANADHLMTHEEPVVLTDTNLVSSALHWDLPYLEQHMGPAKHTVYVSKTRKFMYFDDRKLANHSNFREPMKKREWTFSKFVDEYRAHEGRTDEYIYYQDALTDSVGSNIKRDFIHFNWSWVNERKKRYNWGQLTSNLLLISQPGNVTPCHYDEQHNFFCQVRGLKRCLLFAPDQFKNLYPFPVAHPCDRQSQVDFDNYDDHKFPNMKSLRGYECILSPGDVLYIPMYWWHHIETTPGELAISITFWYKVGVCGRVHDV